MNFVAVEIGSTLLVYSSAPLLSRLQYSVQSQSFAPHSGFPGCVAIKESQ